MIRIITGGGRGIASATALALTDAGHDLVLAYRTDSHAACEVAARVRQRGVRAIAVRADAATELGTVTGLVNNAGLTDTRPPARFATSSTSTCWAPSGAPAAPPR